MPGVKNLLLVLEYDGTNYYGWQRQTKTNLPSIQAETEKALAKLFKQDIKITGSGRTDKGVHAKNQTANFTVKTRIPLKNIKTALNSFLPEDIRVKDIKTVPLNFHSRYSVKTKVYRYVIFNSKNPDIFLRSYSWHIPQKLNLAIMRKIAETIKKTKDFKAFVNCPKGIKNFQRKIYKISIRKQSRFIHIDIEADGFLRGMARNIVKILVSAGKGEITEKQTKQAIKSQDRAKIGKSAPAKGLYLYKVKYR